MKRFFIVLLMLATSTFHHIQPHGFFAPTQVWMSDGKTETIHNLFNTAVAQKKRVRSFNVAPGACCNRLVKKAANGSANCYVRLGFEDDQRSQYISCTPTQEFYLPCEKKWLPAYRIKPGTSLLGINHQQVKLTHIELVKRNLEIYSLEIDGSHNFRVGRHGVLTHNMVISAAAIGFSLAYDSAALFAALTGGGSLLSAFGPLGCAVGLGVGGGLGLLIAKMRAQEDPSFYKLDFKPNLFDNVISKNIINALNEQNAARQPEASFVAGNPTVFFPPDREPLSCGGSTVSDLPDPLQCGHGTEPVFEPKGCGQPPSPPVQTQCNFSKTQPKPAPILIEPFQEPPGLRLPGCGQPTLPEGFPGCRYPGMPNDFGPLFHAQEVERPHGTYEGAGYHHPGSKGEKSPAPKDGQAALDDSVEVPGDKKPGALH